jgi:hypothetical protein
MSFNGSGTFLINTAGQPVVTNTVISSTAFNALTADLGTGLSTTITKDGQTTATAKIPFAQGLSAAAASNFAAGTVAAPGLYLATDTGTGLYRIGANNYGFAVSGAKVLDISSTGLSVTGTLSTTSTAVIGSGVNGSLQINNAGGNNGASLWFSGASVASANKNWLIDSGNFAGSVLSFAIANSAGGVIGSGATEVGRFSSTGLTVTGQVTSSGATNDVAFIAQDSGSVTGFKANNTGAGGRNYSMFSTANASGLGGGLFAIYDNTAGAARMTVSADGEFNINCPTANKYSLTPVNSHASNPFGIYNRFTGADPNSTGNSFLYCEGSTAGGTLRAGIRSNGGLANYSANDVNLSDLDVKPFTQAFDAEKLWRFGKAMRPAWMQFKYDDQTHDDWNNGYGAQLVQEAAGTDFPELVSLGNWGTKDEPKMRLEVYDNDLMHIMGAITTESQFKIEALEARLAALEAK